MARARPIEARGWRYQTSLDRAGHALGVGGALGGGVWAVASLSGGGNALAAASAFFLGTLFTAIGIGSVAAPLWLVLHLAGWRRMRYAALLGAGIGFTVFLFAQTYGFGLFDAPPSDNRTWLYRWASAATTSLLLALVSAAIGMVMWAVGYRRID